MQDDHINNRRQTINVATAAQENTILDFEF